MINEREGGNKFKEKSLDRSLNGSFSLWEKVRMCKPDMVYVLDRGHGLHFY
jgi:hypothetical protein